MQIMTNPFAEHSRPSRITSEALSIPLGRSTDWRRGRNEESMSYTCPICASGDVEDTGFYAENKELKVRHRVYGCLNCTGRFLADRPNSIGKVQVSGDARPSEASIEH